MKRRELLFTCAAVGLGGCAATSSDDSPRARGEQPSGHESWPMPGFGPASTGSNPDASGIGRDPDLQWRASIDANIFSAPAVDGDTAFTGGGTNVYAYDEATGEKRWIADVGSKTAEFTPVVSEGDIYQASGVDGGAVSALDSDDGTTHWHTEIATPTQPVVAGGTIYVGESTDQRACVTALTTAGDIEWTFEVPERPATIQAAQAVADDRVYALVNHGNSPERPGTLRLYALAVEDGSKKWEWETTGSSRAPPTIGDERVYLSNGHGSIHAISKSTREERWRVTTDAPVYSSPALFAGTLLVGTIDRAFYAIDATTGTKQWETESNLSNTDPAVTGDTVYVGGGPLFGFDVATGSTRWSFRDAAFSSSFYSPTPVGDALYVGACLKEESGDLYDNYLYKFGR